MSKKFTLREAKSRLSEILDMVSASVQVEITRQGAKQGWFKLILSDGKFGKRARGARSTMASRSTGRSRPTP